MMLPYPMYSWTVGRAPSSVDFYSICVDFSVMENQNKTQTLQDNQQLQKTYYPFLAETGG